MKKPKKRAVVTEITVDEFFPAGRKRGIKVRVSIERSKDGAVGSYALALIDVQNSAKDNGRILGYDNSHGFHHRHYYGKVESIEYTSHEDLQARFENEVREYLFKNENAD
jgi:hypothetical protein